MSFLGELHFSTYHFNFIIIVKFTLCRTSNRSSESDMTICMFDGAPLVIGVLTKREKKSDERLRNAQGRRQSKCQAFVLEMKRPFAPMEPDYRMHANWTLNICCPHFVHSISSDKHNWIVQLHLSIGCAQISSENCLRLGLSRKKNSLQASLTNSV